MNHRLVRWRLWRTCLVFRFSSYLSSFSCVLRSFVWESSFICQRSFNLLLKFLWERRILWLGWWMLAFLGSGSLVSIFWNLHIVFLLLDGKLVISNLSFKSLSFHLLDVFNDRADRHWLVAQINLSSLHGLLHFLQMLILHLLSSLLEGFCLLLRHLWNGLLQTLWLLLCLLSAGKLAN